MATYRIRTKKDGAKVVNVQVRQTGFPTRTASFPTRRMAERWAATIEASMIEGRHFRNATSRSKTLGEAIERYALENIPALSSAGNMHKAACKWWAEKLGGLKLSDLTQAKIIEYKGILARERYVRAKPQSKRSVVKDGDAKAFLRKPSTVNRYAAVLSSVLTATRSWEWMSTNPIENIAKLPETSDRARVLNIAERQALFEETAKDATLHLFVTVAISTACRAGELVNLKWSDVDVKEGRLLFRKTKNAEPRSAWLHGEAKRLMANHAKTFHQSDDRVFKNASGRGDKYQYADLYAAACEVSGVGKCVLHNLRHTAATLLATDGASEQQLKAIGGWKSGVVSRYIHIAAADTKALVKAMNEKLVAK